MNFVLYTIQALAFSLFRTFSVVKSQNIISAPEALLTINFSSLSTATEKILYSCYLTVFIGFSDLEERSKIAIVVSGEAETILLPSFRYYMLQIPSLINEY